MLRVSFLREVYTVTYDERNDLGIDRKLRRRVAKVVKSCTAV